MRLGRYETVRSVRLRLKKTELVRSITKLISLELPYNSITLFVFEVFVLAVYRVDCSRVGECNRQRGLLSIAYVNWQGRMIMIVSGLSYLAELFGCVFKFISYVCLQIV